MKKVFGEVKEFLNTEIPVKGGEKIFVLTCIFFIGFGLGDMLV